ncbi:MAG: tyrosinase, partial [Rhodospirillaceae bacterium]|nr:tyrosinase [Rhodospirillaceae bacterium]
MAHTRKDVWKLGAGWSDTLSWYARGVSALQQRPITDRTSWTYLASLHGFDEGLWRAFGYFGSAGPFPAPGDALPLQCQHQSWYFLP